MKMGVIANKNDIITPANVFEGIQFQNVCSVIQDKSIQSSNSETL